MSPKTLLSALRKCERSAPPFVRTTIGKTFRGRINRNARLADKIEKKLLKLFALFNALKDYPIVEYRYTQQYDFGATHVCPELFDRLRKLENK